MAAGAEAEAATEVVVAESLTSVRDLPGSLL